MDMNLENEISIIILNYFNYKLTTACVDNLLNLELESRIIIVDNNSQNESYKYLKDYYRNTITVDVIKNNVNKGYADGNNYGAKFAVDKYPNTKYICIMNPDVIVSYRNIFSNLAYKIKIRKDVAAISPIMLVNGKLDSKLMCWGTPTNKSIILDHLVFRKKYNTAPMKDIYPDKDGVAIVDVIPGSFFMIKVKSLLQVNMLDTGTFLYNEENILSLKLRNLNLNEALSINDFYFHNHLENVKTKSLKDKINGNKILYNSTSYLQKNFYKNNLAQLGLKIINLLNYVYIFSSHMPAKIKRKIQNKRKI